MATGKISPRSAKYRLSRRGRKLQISDDPRILLALPKDVPERTWAEILQKEENDLICFEIREEILEEALQIGYENYMARQTTAFTVHCAAQAWLKLIDWHFYRHDPGEDPTAYPPCYIPKRKESWIPDEPPSPSPKDCWGRQELKAIEECPDLTLLERWDSSSSLEINVVEDIPEEYWFPGKVNLAALQDESDIKNQTGGRHNKSRKSKEGWDSYADSSDLSHKIGADSEVLQRVTNYSNVDDSIVGRQETTSTLRSESESSFVHAEERLDNDSEMLQRVTDYGADYAAGDKLKKLSKHSTHHALSQTEASLQGGGDSAIGGEKLRKRGSKFDKSKSAAWSRVSLGKSRGYLLPPMLAESLSQVTNISDCRLRNLRVDTHFEVSSEKIDSPQVGKETTSRKK